MGNDGWTLAYDAFEPSREGLREALCTLGNGFFCTRGAAPESEADDVHYPGTYLAGGYNRLKTEVAGRVVENEDLVNMPNWLLLKFRPEDGDWLNLMSVEILSYRQELDMKAGVLIRTVRFRDGRSRETTVMLRRFVHMAAMHLAALEMTIMPENWSGRIRIHSALDGTVVNAGVERYRRLNGAHLAPVGSGPANDDGIYLLVETNQSRIRVAEAARTRVYFGDEQADVARNIRQEPGYIAQDCLVEAVKGRPVRIEKIVSIHTSRDFAISEPVTDAVEGIRQAAPFDALLAGHMKQWSHLWDRCDIQVWGDERAQMILRLHVFHLLQTASRNSIDLDTGVPARGWHGEAYRGHIFWDELFIFPYLNMRIPVLTRSLLLYRYRRLDRARTAAWEAGFRGAMFPWQSGSNGREETQELHLNPESGRWLPDNTHLQRHVNAAIAYNLWQYYQATGDEEFMATYGVEMMLEIARLFSSIATYNEELGRHEILGVMGPDEYHDRYPGSDRPGVDNNAYTNVMAVWVMRTAMKALDVIQAGRRSDLLDTIGLDHSEIDRWRDIVRTMRVVFHDDGIISQFEGYDRLAEFDFEGYRRKYGNIRRLDRILEAEGDSVSRYKVSKQADVLMLYYLFSAEELRELFERMGYDFHPLSIPKNIEYYLQRCSNGSTLGNVVHSWVLARSDRPGAWELFNRALESDISDIQDGTTHEGIHTGAMAGTVDIVQRCFTGMEFRDDVLCFNPRLPGNRTRLGMKIKYRGNWFDLMLDGESMTIASRTSQIRTAKIGHDGRVYELPPGERLTFAVRNKGAG
ncbi:MAG: glycosyl hydrolase family 65 protein [bacterium]|nr:glycosyl hydrolase family 65 protein [bacterium]